MAGGWGPILAHLLLGEIACGDCCPSRLRLGSGGCWPWGEVGEAWHCLWRAESSGLLGSASPLSSLVLHNIARGIFETIVEQAPFAIEDLMNEMDAQNGEDEASGGDSGSVEGECDQDPPSIDFLQVRLPVC